MTALTLRAPARLVSAEGITFTWPRSDPELSEWMQLAAAAIARDPARYALPPATAAPLPRAATVFADAILTCRSTAPNPAATREKDEAREAAQRLFQPLIAHIRTSREIALADKLDIGMPGMDGYELAQRIRSTSWGRDMTLIALTGWDQEKDKGRAAGAGFHAHLTKPADIEAIERALNQEHAPRT